jgi:hypothetical protein
MEIIELPTTSTFNDIIAVVDGDKTIGKMFYFKMGATKVQAERKYKWRGNTALTSYLHIYKVKEFAGVILEHWREQKDGSFKTL